MAKKRELTDTPAGLVAVLISAKKSGDDILATDAERQLRQRYGVTVQFAEPTTTRSKAVANA